MFCGVMLLDHIAVVIKQINYNYGYYKVLSCFLK